MAVSIAMALSVAMAVSAVAGAPVWRPVAQPATLRGTSSELVAVSCPSRIDCVGVGSESPGSGNLEGDGEPLIESWDGHRWSVVAPTGAVSGSDADRIGQVPSLAGVSCLSGGWCVAVGSNESSSEIAPVIEMSAGGRWRIAANRVVAAGPAGALNAVSCVTRSMCVAVGGAELGRGTVPLIERWDGRTWARFTPAPGPPSGDVSLTGVACTAVRSCTAVGERASFDPLDETTVIEDWNGSTWSVVPSPNPGPEGSGLAAISCHGATLCTAVGSEGGLTATSRPLIEISVGRRWTIDPVHLKGPDHSSVLSGVSCGVPPFCTAVGYVQEGAYGSSSVPLIFETGGSRAEGPSVEISGRDVVTQVAIRQPATTGSGGRGSLLRAVSCAPVLICTATGTNLGDADALVISNDAPLGPQRSSFPLLLVPTAAVVVLAAAAPVVVRRRRSGPRSPPDPEDVAGGAGEGDPATDGAEGAGAGGRPTPPAPPEDPTVWAPSGDRTTAPPPLPLVEPPLWADDPDDSSRWAPPGH